MKFLRKALTLSLFILPIVSIYYKVNIEKMSFIPVSSSDQWRIEVSYNVEKIFEKFKVDHIKLPLINSWHNQEIISRKITESKNSNIKTALQDDLLRVERGQYRKISVITRLKLADSIYGTPMRSSSKGDDLKRLKKKYLKLNGLPKESLSQIRILNGKFSFEGDSPRQKMRKIYYYITEEITTNKKVNNLAEVINLSEGSERAKAQLMTSLARLNNIPARTNLAYKIQQAKREKRLKKTFLPEVLIEGYWYPVSVNATTFTRVPTNHFIVDKDFDLISNIFTEKMTSIKIAPIMINKVDSTDYTKKLATVNSFFSMISLHNLPLSMQTVFITVLLIPVGTILLSLCRNLIGVRTFGIFTPILLSLFFLETSLLTGSIFLLFIVALGFFQRYAIDKLYLLAVPRISILLTLVVISYCILGLYSVQEGSFLNGGALSYFPIVIIVVFIERFSVHFIEEGAVNTLKTFFGTALVSLLCYTVFRIEFLKLALFNHPELLLIVIGGNIIIGSYKGYRISELFRFKEFRRVDS